MRKSQVARIGNRAPFTGASSVPLLAGPASCRVRPECLDRILVLGTRRLYRVVGEHELYFTCARPHQGFGKPVPASWGGDTDREQGERSSHTRCRGGH